MDDLKSFKNELQNVIKGKSSSGESDSIQAAKTYLRNHTRPGSEGQSSNQGRPEEERALREYARQNGLFIDKSDLGHFITSGAEQKVFYKANSSTLFKIADAIFYLKWEDYFNNLLLHNRFFPDTAYTLVGFLEEDARLHAVVKQEFVLLTEKTNLEAVKDHLLANGFVNKKNNDYYHPYLGIILEDLHDENVLTSNGLLFFVDTVFYLTDVFYS
ncbi:MAG TPA: hypothetical protein VFI06_02530 [Chitinophagaceae bacterium]|nr:hypothetical protein [Chitinophagaceae bacterium]